jgi:hypothetical protein
VRTLFMTSMEGSLCVCGQGGGSLLCGLRQLRDAAARPVARRAA